MGQRDEVVKDDVHDSGRPAGEDHTAQGGVAVGPGTGARVPIGASSRSIRWGNTRSPDASCKAASS